MQNNWVPIIRTDTHIKIKKHNINSPSIRRTQFPLALSWACTVHKVQGLSLEKAVISFQLHKQKAFNAGQMYVALSRVRSMNGLFLVGSFSRKAIKINDEVSKEYDRLHTECPFSPLEICSFVDNNLVFALLNCRSLKKHAIDVSRDKELTNCDLVFLTETQLYLDEGISNIKRKLSDLNVEVNSAEYKFSSLALLYTNAVQLVNHDKYEGVSFLTIKKSTFQRNCFRVVLIYRINGGSIQTFYEKLQQLLVTHEKLDFIMGDFNINALDSKICTRLCHILEDYQLLLNESTHLSGSFLDQIYLHKSWLQFNFVKSYIKSVYFSDHDAVKVVVTSKGSE